MAATNPTIPASTRNALQALTAAALLLPGLLASPARAAEHTLALQASRYAEGARDLVNVESGLKPLSADTLRASAAFTLRDSYRLSLGLTQDTWSGATPVASSALGANGNRPILRNASLSSAQGLIIAGASPMLNGLVRADADQRGVLVMSSASPEIRRQADVSLAFPAEALRPDIEFTLGAGISDEPDYLSRYGRIGGTLAFNQQLTTLNLGGAFTRSSTSALLDPDALPYLARGAYAAQLERRGATELLRGERRDRALELGLTQVIDSESLLDLGFGLTRSSGFMENPYKATTVLFSGPAADTRDMRALLEQRPDTRRQLAFHTHYARHFAGANGTLQLDYSRSRDDWDVAAHSMELGWAQTLGAWTLTPRLRYYTQSAADFYTPWLVSNQSFRSIAQDSAGRQVWTGGAQQDYFRTSAGAFIDASGAEVDTAALNLQPRFNTYSAALLPAHFASDHRLSAFGSLSASLTVQRRFAAGFAVEAGIEYYERAHGLQAGSGADSAFADFDFVMANLALTVDLQTTAARARRAQASAASHADSLHNAAQPTAPAGLMFAHHAMAPGSFMTGYRASHSRQHGALLHGAHAASDAEVLARGCQPVARCRSAPERMAMTMHMLDLSYAFSASFALMVMPQYMTMNAKARELAGGPAPIPGLHAHGGANHASGAIGDTIVAGLFRLSPSLQASLGVGLPTGKTDLRYRRSFQSEGGLMHYDMQTGSGTWDLWPTLTWSVVRSAWRWSAQAGGIKRLGGYNDMGYQLGDRWHLTAWVTRALSNTFSASLRFTQAGQQRIAGGFNAAGAASPMDLAANQGGRFQDIGFGIDYQPGTSTLSLEWLAPLRDEINGFQLERQGTLAATWHYLY